MTRRGFLFPLAAAIPAAAQIQQQGATNAPRCPVCRAEATYPNLSPVVRGVTAGELVTLDGMKLLVCEACGNLFAAQTTT